MVQKRGMDQVVIMKKAIEVFTIEVVEASFDCFDRFDFFN